MAEEFQAGICDASWWSIYNSSKGGLFPLGSSPCSMAANYNDGGNYMSTWQIDDWMDLKQPTRSNCEGMVSDHSLGFPDEQLEKPKQSEPSAKGNGGILMNSTSQMMGFARSSSSSTPSNWNNQSLLGRPAESSFHSVLEEEAAGIGSSNSQIKTNWSPKGQVPSINNALVKPMMNQEFSLDQQSKLSSAAPCGYLYDGPNNSPLHHPHSQPQPQPQHSLFTNRSVAYSYNSPNELSPTWSKVSSFLKPSMPKQQLSGFPFSNNDAPFWNNASAEALDDVRADHVFVSPSPPLPQAQYQSQTFEAKPNCASLLTKHKREEGPDLAQVMNRSVCEPVFKRPRIETPSPLPTFKVRKEKLGDRITALQQLVSPFGKTDTASVLHEAIDYIKYLHEQVSVLSAPYLNNGVPTKHRQSCCMKESEAKQDLRSQGLCLVPLSSTLPVANYEMNAELWTPTYGSSIMKQRR